MSDLESSPIVFVLRDKWGPVHAREVRHDVSEWNRSVPSGAPYSSDACIEVDWLVKKLAGFAADCRKEALYRATSAGQIMLDRAEVYDAVREMITRELEGT